MGYRLVQTTKIPNQSLFLILLKAIFYEQLLKFSNILLYTQRPLFKMVRFRIVLLFGLKCS